MAARIDPKTLRKVRDMIRAGFSQAEAGRACGVSKDTAVAQGKLLEAFEGVRRNDAGNLAKAIRAQSDKFAAKRMIARTHEYDPEALVLVDMLATPRTIRQLRRFAGDDT
jgi:hypothetical protein